MPNIDEVRAQHARQAARRKRRRQVAALIAVVVLVGALSTAVLVARRWGAQGPLPSTVTSATHSPGPRSSSSQAPAATVAPSATPAPTDAPTSVARPHITKDYIDYSGQRRAEMSAYSLKHYGTKDIRLDPKTIVLHYTCGSDYGSAHQLFDSNVPNMGVKPGVVSQFVIDKDGTIYQQIPLDIEGRHAVGLNYAAIGIECVQECGSSDAQTVHAIMARKKQISSLIALVRWLMQKYDIPVSSVIGHGMADDSPYYKDLLGWKNSHTDWLKPQVERFRKRLKSVE